METLNQSELNEELLQDEKYLVFFENENNCPLCGTDLELSYDSNYQTRTVRESAQCPSCKIQIKSREFAIQ